MKNVIILIKSMPLWLLIALPIAVGVILLLIIWLILRGRFTHNLKRLYQEPDKYKTRLAQRYSASSLQRRSGQIEKMARKLGPEIITLLGMDEVWIKNLQVKKRKKDFLRVLTYAPDKGLFQCFLISTENKALAPFLISWLEASKDFLHMRRLALAGIGEPFNGKEAYAIFADKISEIREMTGDPEWPARYFAVKILLYDDDARSERVLWDALQDPHPLIRKSVAAEFQPETREKFHRQLLDLTLNDPAFEVRKTAWERIHRDFSDLHELAPEKLDETQIFHVLELLRFDSKEDESIALNFLGTSNLEHRFAAANYLAKCGALKRLCQEVDLADKEALERNYQLLEKASQVNITSFLSAIKETDNPATLLICAKILIITGERTYIYPLAKKVFAQFNNQADFFEIYALTVKTVSQRGSEESLQLLNQELIKWKDNKKLMDLLISVLPEQGDFFYLDTLLAFLHEPGFAAKDTLRSTLKRISPPLVLQQVFKILQSNRGTYLHPVRMEAAKLLGEMGMPYCLQTILENLPVLPVQEAKEFTTVLSQFPSDQFNKKVEKLLDGPDAKVRASLIASLAATGEKNFLKTIRQSLKDADPDVRIAAVWSLVEFQDYRSLNQAASMLRDPVERVRREVAKAFGSYGSKESLSQLKDLLSEKEEIDAVKGAAIEGLGVSASLAAIDILLDNLAKEDGLTAEITQALARKNDKKEIARIIECFKDASPALREKISAVFREKKEAGEATILELLREDIPSLKPFLVEILETTGLVEAKIRTLSHRDPVVRRDAAEFLALIGSQPAFRGMVLAARDPSEEVRVKVIKALEKLGTEEGNVILQALESDPDKKVRKYTLWALERVRAKAL